MKSRFFAGTLRLLFRLKDPKIFIVYLNAVVTAFSGIVVSALAVGVLGSEVYGWFVILLTVILLAVDLIGTRSNEATVYFLERGYGKNTVLRVSVLLDCIVVAAYIIACCLLYYFLEQHVSPNEDYARVYWCLVWYAVASLGSGTAQGFLIFHRRLHYVSSVMLCASLIRIVGVGILAFNDELSVRSLAMAYTWSSIPFFLLVIGGIALVVKGARKKDLKSVPRAEFYRFSLKTYASSLLKAGNKKVDVLILGFVVSESTAGIYDLAKKFAGPVQLIAGPLSDIYLKKFMELAKAREFPELRRIVVEANKKLIFVQVLVGVAGGVGCGAIFFWGASGLFLPESFGLFPLMFVAVYFIECIKQLTWWGRPFSVSSNPTYSIVCNLYMTGMYFGVCWPAAYYFSNAGFLLSVMAMVVGLLVLWWQLLSLEEKVC